MPTRQTIPNILSIARAICALLFLLAFLFAEYPWVWLILAIIYTYIELSDLFDGIIARRTNTVSTFGKLFDPIADIISRTTVMFCLFKDSLWWPLVMLIMIREISMCYTRMHALYNNIVLSADWSGKLKAVFYSATNISALLVFLAEIIHLADNAVIVIVSFLQVACLFASVISAYTSLIHYVLFIRRKTAENREKTARHREH